MRRRRYGQISAVGPTISLRSKDAQDVAGSHISKGAKGIGGVTVDPRNVADINDIDRVWAGASSARVTRV